MERDFILDYLKKANINYKEYIFESELNNMWLCSVAEKEADCCIFKNLFLQNRQGTEFFLLLMHPNKKFRTAVVSKQLGKSRLSFGTEDKLKEYLHCNPGAITPFGLIFDDTNFVNLVVDKDLSNNKYVGVHPFDGDKIVKLTMDDLVEKILKNNGRAITYVDIDNED